MLLAANLANTKLQMLQKTWKITETLAHGYSSESTQLELSKGIDGFKYLCVLELWTKVASELEGLKSAI